MTDPKVSVCIPTYNQTRYLRTTLESLLKQRFEDYEIVVTDDSEGDEVQKLVAQYDFGGRLHYSRNVPKRGSPGNWNSAVSMTRGSYIKMLHHDDWFPNDQALGEYVALLDLHSDCAFGFSATDVFYADGKFHRTHCASRGELAAIAQWPETLYFGNIVGAPSATIYRREAALDYDEHLKWLVDVDLYIRLLRVHPSFAFTERALICTPTGVSHQVTESSINNPLVELVENLLVLAKVYPRLESHPFLVKYWRNLLARHRVWTRQALESYAVVPASLDDFFDRVFVSLWYLKVRYRVVGILRRLYSRK